MLLPASDPGGGSFASENFVWVRGRARWDEPLGNKGNQNAGEGSGCDHRSLGKGGRQFARVVSQCSKCEVIDPGEAMAISG